MSRIEYQSASLEKVAAHFVKDYQLPPGCKLLKHEVFFDPVRGVFLFELFMEDTTVEKQP